MTHIKSCQGEENRKLVQITRIVHHFPLSITANQQKNVRVHFICLERSRPTRDERAFCSKKNESISHYEFVLLFDSKSKWTDAKQAAANAFPIIFHVLFFFFVLFFDSFLSELFAMSMMYTPHVESHNYIRTHNTHTYTTFWCSWNKLSVYFHSRDTARKNRKSRKSKSSNSLNL